MLSTWTLCTVPDPGQVLAEIVRVLRPGGSLCFAEHGLAPDAQVARRQRQFSPLQQLAFGGCRLDRPIDQLILASGLVVSKLDTYYLPGRGPSATRSKERPRRRVRLGLADG